MSRALEMYELGERVLYGNRGVCTVSAVGALPFGSDKTKQYYTLKPVFDMHSETIYAPVEGRVNMRRLITPAQAESYIKGADSLEEVSADADEKFREMIKSQDCKSLFTWVKAMYTRGETVAAEKKRLRESDKRALEQAEKLVLGELAAVLETSPDEMRERLLIAFKIGTEA